MRESALVVTVEEVRAVVLPLPRSYEVFVYGRRKFRVGQIVYLAFSRDETTMGFAFPKEWRAIVVEAEPRKFEMPSASDMRFNWLHARLVALDSEEMHDLVMDAWRMVVPKRVAAEWDARLPTLHRSPRASTALRRRPQL
jgi:hypothetical protein